MKAAESLALIIVLAVAAPVRATVIVNGDFSANAAAFTNSPGYTGGANPVTDNLGMAPYKRMEHATMPIIA